MDKANSIFTEVCLGGGVEAVNAHSSVVAEPSPPRKPSCGGVGARSAAVAPPRVVLGAREALAKVGARLEELSNDLQIYLGDFLCSKLSNPAVQELPGEAFAERSEVTPQHYWEGYEVPQNDGGALLAGPPPPSLHLCLVSPSFLVFTSSTTLPSLSVATPPRFPAVALPASLAYPQFPSVTLPHLLPPNILGSLLSPPFLPYLGLAIRNLPLFASPPFLLPYPEPS